MGVYNRMVFGLVSAATTYQRRMEKYTGDYIVKLCFIYSDDLQIFLRSFEEHLDRLAKVMQRAWAQVIAECAPFQPI